MSRNNQSRLAAPIEDAQEGQIFANNNLNFPRSTQYVDLPSEGLCYPKNSPLYNKKTVEIKDLTTKEEDILSNMDYIKRGVVFDKLLDSIIVDKSVKPGDLLPGDKDALLIAARIDGYGPQYVVSDIQCPKCEKKQDFSYNLLDFAPINHLVGLETWKEALEESESGTFHLLIKHSNLLLELKLLNSKELLEVEKQTEEQRDKKKEPTPKFNQLSKMIVSVNGSSDREDIKNAINSLKGYDVRFILKVYTDLNPKVDKRLEFVCSTPGCDHTEKTEVQITYKFFWFD